MGVLGCETHTISVTARSGGIVLAAGTGLLTDIEWTRVLNDFSTATATVGVTGPECCAQLGSLRSWAMSLNVFRGGDFVWSGPIVNIDWKYDRVTITAVDIIGLLDLRVPHQDLTYTDTDLTEIAEDLIEDGFAPDDPGHTVTIVGAAGVTGGREYFRNVGQTADHLRDLADTGIDFTAVGNNIVILPEDYCGVVGHLSDPDLPDGVTVTEDGASLATRQIVAGASSALANSDPSDVIGTAGGTHAYYGLLERYTEQTSITTQAGADAAAASKLRVSAVVPVTIDTQNVTLAPTAPVDLLTLVPGWCLDISTAVTCREITQRLKITGLKVSEDGGSGDTPGQEKILVQVAATGADDTSVSGSLS